MKKCVNGTEDLAALKADFELVKTRLDCAMTGGSLSAYEHRVILDMSVRVIRSLTRKYKDAGKGVIRIMGGKVLEHEGKTIFNEGRKEGVKEGMEKGMEAKQREIAFRLRDKGTAPEAIAEIVDAELSDILGWFAQPHQG